MSSEYIFRKTLQWITIGLFPATVIFWAIKKRKQKIVKNVENRLQTIIVRSTALISYTLIILSLALDFGRIDWRKAFPSQQHYLTVVYTGIVVALLGDLLIMWSLYHLKFNCTMQTSVLQNHELVISGPYHFCRHPMYTSAYTYAIGIFLLSGYWVIGLGLLFQFTGATVRLRDEERQLIRQFGAKYIDYMNKVNPFLPFLPSSLDCGIDLGKEKRNLLNAYLELQNSDNNTNSTNNNNDNNTSTNNNGNNQPVVNINSNVTTTTEI